MPEWQNADKTVHSFCFFDWDCSRFCSDVMHHACLNHQNIDSLWTASRMRLVIHLYGKHRLSNPLLRTVRDSPSTHTCDVISQRHYASRNTRVICYIRRPVARGFVSPLGCMSPVTKLLRHAVPCGTSVGRQNRINPAKSGVISVAIRLISTTFSYVCVPHSTYTLQSF